MSLTTSTPSAERSADGDHDDDDDRAIHQEFGDALADSGPVPPRR